MKRESGKIGVAILGATGMVGQKFVELLQGHPWFTVVCLAASERSSGRRYGDVVNWQMNTPLDQEVASMVVRSCDEVAGCSLAFSGLDSSVAGEVEKSLACQGVMVISNAKNHRMVADVPLLIPEVNPEHIELVKYQNYPSGGAIVTNPNCSVVGLVTALKPLADNWKVRQVDVSTLQALSGAGYPGVSSLELVDNVIPFISGEEEKVESEPKKILGRREGSSIIPYEMVIRAHCNRVPVIDGHTECVTVELEGTPTKEEIIDAWNSFAEEAAKELPSSPVRPLHYFHEESYPQPRRHRHLGKGMTVSLGRLRQSSDGAWKFALLSHNTIRGAAGGALLNAELLIKKGVVLN